MASKSWGAFATVCGVIFAVLKEFGLSGALVGAISAVAMGGRAHAERQPMVTLVFYALGIFVVVVFLWTLARAYWREYRRYPLYDEWEEIDTLHLWQAACLWSQVEPYLPVAPGTRAYPRLHLLKGTIADGDLTPIIKVTAKDDEAIFWARLRKDDLRKYVQQKNLKRPRFLFPR